MNPRTARFVAFHEERTEKLEELRPAKPEKADSIKEIRALARLRYIARLWIGWGQYFQAPTFPHCPQPP